MQEQQKQIRRKIASRLKISQEYIQYSDNQLYITNFSYKKSTRDDNPLDIHHFAFAVIELCECPLHFSDCRFKDIVIEYPQKIKEDIYLSFTRCEFLKQVDLHKYETPIKHTISMKDCIFYDEVIINKIFNEDVYFNNSIFKKYVDFHESRFNKTACFYGVTFEEVPNFSQVLFKGNLNLINTNLNFDFNECKEVVKKELTCQREREKGMKKQKITPKIPKKAPEKVANDFRDSFRVFKNALIKDNNLLDASNYHKIELYFKEIELKAKKPLKFSKEWIDMWQLKLYRLTSNHHTDLLKIFSCLMSVIGIFATMIFVSENLDIFLNIKVIIGIFGVALIAFLIYVYEQISLFTFLTLLSFIPCFWLLGSNPKCIFGIARLFTSESENSLWLNIVFSVYTIFFILLIFSLQKTARRNSIIPT